MATAILQMEGGLELRSDDRLTCRTMYRLMSSSISRDDRQQLLEPLVNTNPDSADLA